MIIEFFGLPGSGKTTLSRIAADILAERGHNVSQNTHRIEKIRYKAIRLLIKFSHSIDYFARHPCRGAAAATSIAGTKQATANDLSKALLNWMYIASISSKRRSARQIAILDQGIAQALWSIGFAAQHEAWLDLVIEQTHWRMFRPDLIIHVRADHGTIATRLAKRQIRMSRLDHIGYDLSRLQQAQAQSDIILQTLRSDGIRVLEIDNDCRGRLDSNARFIANSIAAMLDNKDDVIHAALKEDAISEEMSQVCGLQELNGTR